MIHASYLFLLTDVDSLYESNPKYDIHASRIDLVRSISSLKDRSKPSSIDCPCVPLLTKLPVDSSNLGPGSANGTGGMATKLRAAEIASAAGIFTVLASSSRPSVVSEILEYYNDERMFDLASTTSDSFHTIAVSSDKDARPLHTLFFPEPSPRQPPSLTPLGFRIPPVSI